MSSDPDIPGYEVLRRLGQGAMGETWIVRRSGAFTPSVLKWMRPDHLVRKDSLDRFVREARLLSLLHHPHVVSVEDAGWVGKHFYLTTEWVPGIELQTLMETLSTLGPPPPGLTASLIQQVLSGLHAAHELKDPQGRPLEVVHRDLSPRNILIGFDGRARIIDFGLAHGALDQTHTLPGTMMGTLGYMAPEQCRGAAVDRRADLYAVGAIWYALLTARPLIRAASQRELVRKLVRDHTPHFDPRDDVSPDQIEAVRRATAREPNRRFATAARFRQAALQSGPTPWTETQVSEFMHVRFAGRWAELQRQGLVGDGEPDEGTATLEIPFALRPRERNPTVARAAAPAGPSRAERLLPWAVGLASGVLCAVGWLWLLQQSAPTPLRVEEVPVEPEVPQPGGLGPWPDGAPARQADGERDPAAAESGPE
ncbi:MAG TPA: serine/threonine-protein kinase [Myxococcales bacterium LLY-WYZ-16_1]|nr:serine/threonine-protein kinase [Myxococcales bacterium LLY-WYZ-16_1]